MNNKKYDKVAGLEDQTRRKSYQINTEQMITKLYLYHKSNRDTFGIKYHDIKFIEENKYFLIPFKLKQQ